jgi:hypothetical protein
LAKIIGKPGLIAGYRHSLVLGLAGEHEHQAGFAPSCGTAGASASRNRSGSTAI